eukprot:PITA_06689
MQKEYDALIKNGTWKPIEPPLGTKQIGCKWFYKNKYKADGSVDKHKSRLVAKGFAQKEGVDYEETFASTTKWATIHALFTLIAQKGAVSWISPKQSVPADSTTEAEYVATTEATKEIVWLRKILEDLQVKQVQSTPLMIDNTSAIKLAKNPKFHDQTKHINTKYHLI